MGIGSHHSQCWQPALLTVIRGMGPIIPRIFFAPLGRIYMCADIDSFDFHNSTGLRG